MALLSRTLLVAAALALTSLGACATEPGDVADQSRFAPPPPPAPPVLATPPSTWAAAPAATLPVDGLLPAPPSNAVPGECYAKVVVPGQPIAAPPPQPRAVWVLTPPGPGQVVPSWCLYYEPGAPRPVTFTPERYGWIRVICERDATQDAIRHVQHRLNAYGDYHGVYDGKYDPETARGVARFQEQRHIRHGGYLSVKTVEALDASPPALPPPMLTPPPPVLVPACGPPACAGPGSFGQNGPYGPYATPPYRSLLNWPGKSIY